ncbi:unnamed protein product [Prorocentrum cordatum]|uniref:RNA-directed RNA polymerase n=1 Tax=Prorocentrum cordatum TaxID=2364126 RepID=A0ABN9VMK9_9DINO|nr:unnamed protein product [Polarella glacialis]
MIHDLTLPLASFGMTWKASSLLFMTCGLAPRFNADGVILPEEDLIVTTSEVLRFRRVSSMNVLGVEIHSEFNTPTHPDVDHRLSMARKSFYGMSNYSRRFAVSIRDKFWRYEEKVQGIAMCGIEGITLDNHSIQRMRSFEGLCLCKMFTCPRGPEEDVATWSRRRYSEARRKFQEMGFASLVQRFLRVSWNLAKDMREFIHVLEADTYDEWRSAGRTWRDVRACLCAYGAMWDRIRTDASEFLRMNFYLREPSPMKRQRGGGLAIGQRHWAHMLSEFFGPKWWEDFRATPGAFGQFAARVCSREMLDCFQIRAKTYSHPRATGEVHIQTQQELQEYGVEEGSQTANDRLAKRLAVHTSK